MRRFLLVGAAIAGLLAAPASALAADKLLNASYDVARELFVARERGLRRRSHPGVTIDQSHAGTSKQARAIVEGLEADVVTFNQVTDIDFLVKNGFVSDDWQKDFANNASPFYSLPVLPGARRQPEEHQGLGRSRPRRREGRSSRTRRPRAMRATPIWPPPPTPRKPSTATRPR